MEEAEDKQTINIVEEEEKIASDDKSESKVKYYEWNEEMESRAKELIVQAEKDRVALVTENMYAKYEKDAKRNWDLFYKANKTNFYKDRHYIKHEFTELAEKLDAQGQKSYTLIDAGCGVGNGFYPLFNEYKANLRVNCCDFSPRAVEFVKQNESYDETLIDAKVCDLVIDPALPFIKETADFGIMLFVLSAISPEHHVEAARKIFEQMAPGGILYFRDYGRYDLAQLRLAQRSNQKLKENFYVRSDKTRAYYFTIEEVREIFVGVGFQEHENSYHHRLIENRKDQKTMHRVWIQSKFVRPEITAHTETVYQSQAPLDVTVQNEDQSNQC